MISARALGAVFGICSLAGSGAAGVDGGAAATAETAFAAHAATETSGDDPAREMRFTYDVMVREIPADAASFELWLPIPASTETQRLEDLQVRCDLPYTVEEDPEYGNRILHVSQAGEVPQDLQVTVAFDVTRRRIDRLAGPRAGETHEVRALLDRFLLRDRLVPIDGPIAEEAKAIAGNIEDPLSRARALYDHVVGSVRYEKTGTGWGRGDALYACDVRTGNCTDFHSLFIGLARASGLPARFVMGFPVPADRHEGEIPGYHCWAEFYVEGKGWLPIDASEAFKDPGRVEELFGGLDENRVAFTVGRDIRLPSAPEHEPLNYFIYPHVLVGGEPHDNVTRRLWFRDHDRG